MDPDPAPDSAGVYIAGSIYTWDGCTGDVTDSDGDGLSDDCEQILAHTFAPNLSVQTYDDVRGEPRWAARPDDGSMVVVLYMLSYWEDGRDTGDSSWWCGIPIVNSLLLEPAGCGGHAGDSEYIVEGIRYNSTTHHWELAWVDGSKHDGVRTWGHRSTDPKTILTDNLEYFLTFEGAPLSAPTIWVADGKHANYSNKTECDDLGAAFLGIQTDSDACDSDRTLMALDIGLQNENNVGSISTQLIDCVETAFTTHPDYASHATECYWTVKKFHGWWNSSSDVGQLAYASVLSTYGFGS